MNVKQFLSIYAKITIAMIILALIRIIFNM